MTKEQLLKVLDMSEDEQWEQCYRHIPEFGQHEYSLADLAFRLRDKYLSIDYERATWMVCCYVKKMQCIYINCGEEQLHAVVKDGWWIYHSKPIHWIIAALIAREINNA